MIASAELSDDQHLNQVVGLAFRLNIWLGMTTHTAYRELHRAIAPQFDGEPTTDEMLEQAIELVRDAGFENAVVDAGVAALSSARAAHAECSRLLSDELVDKDDLGDKWLRGIDPLADRPLPKSGLVTEAAIEATIEQLHRAQHQLTSFIFVIQATEFGYDSIADLYESNLAIARGEFKVAEDGRAIPSVISV